MIEPRVRRPRCVAGPKTGMVRDSLTVLSAALANGGVEAVVLVISDREGVSYHLHGGMKSVHLAYAGAVLQKWATEKA